MALATIRPVHAGSVTIQPIQVCTNGGEICANPNRELFDAFTQTIWAQAGINVEFLDWSTVYSSAFFDIPDERRLDILWGLPTAATGGSLTPNVISMWFVNSLIVDAAGVSLYPGNQIVISDQVLRFNNPLYGGGNIPSGGSFIFHGGFIPVWTFGNEVVPAGNVQGRTDTIAHEIGHALGLDHCDPQCSGPYLMAANRTIPSNTGQIRPVGPLSTLADDEIRIARSSPLVNLAAEWELTYVQLIPIGVELAGSVARNPGLVFNPSGIRIDEPVIYEPSTPGGSWTTDPPGSGSGAGQTPGPGRPTDPTPATIPEPGTYTMLATGLLLIGLSRWKWRRNN